MIILWLYLAFSYGFSTSMYYFEIFENNGEICMSDFWIWLFTPVILPIFLIREYVERKRDKPFNL